MSLLKQSTARNRVILMIDSSDHVTGKTGLTLTITASKNGAAFGSISPTVTELATGFYNLALTTGHTDTLGDLALHIASAGADATDLVDDVVVDLPGATVASVTGAVGSVTGAVGSVTGNVGGNVVGTVAAVVNPNHYNPTTKYNLVTYSEDFSQAVWLLDASSVTVNATMAPDGSLTGNKIVEDTATAEHAIYQNFSGANGATYTLSCCLKAAERTVGYLIIRSKDNVANYMFVNLSTGAPGSTGGANYVTSSITDLGSGWYLCSVTATLATGGTTPYFEIECSTGTTPGSQTYTGNGASGIYAWGAQLTNSAFVAYQPVPHARVLDSIEAARLKTSYLPSATAGAAGGVFIAGSNAATSITTALTANIIGNLSGSVGSVTGAVGSVTGAVGSVVGNVGGSVASVATGGIAAASFAAGAIDAAAIATGAIDADAIATDALGALELAAGAASEIATAVRTELATELGRVDVAVSTRLASAGYTAPDNVSITAIKAKTDNLPVDPADASDIAGAFSTVNTTLGTIAGYIDTEVAAIKAKTDNLPASPAAVSDIPTAAAVSDAVWDEAIAGHLGAGSTGEALNAAGGAGDPWNTALPGAYVAGKAGFILGTNLDALVSSRTKPADTQAAVTSVTNDVGITQAGADKVWASAARTLTSFGTVVADVATAVWGAATRLLTAGTNIVLAKGVGVTGFNDLSAAQVNTEADTALADVGVTGTVTGRIDAAISSRLAGGSYTAPDNAGIATAVAGAAAIFARTDVATSTRAAAGDAMALTAGERGSVADKVLGRNLAGGSDGGRTVQDALRPLRNKTQIASGTLTVFEEDDTTSAWTAVVSTAPSDPLSAINPA